MADERRHAPATLRNRDPILAVLQRVLPAAGVVLEVASGTGEHVVFFAAHLPGLAFQPSDPDAANRASIAAWRDHAALSNVLPPLALDATAEVWPMTRADAMLCINMIHIARWAACEGLVRGAARLLAVGGALVMYGPFRRGGEHVSPSNAEFDRSLRAQDPAWGVRDVDDVARAAERHALELAESIAMPSNNLTLVFRLRAPAVMRDQQ